MKRQVKKFGDLAKELRTSKRITLKEMAETLGISLSLLSDIESDRRKPLNAEKIEKLIFKVDASETTRNELYDLAARDNNGQIPEDIGDIFMYEEIGDIARLALRKSNQGKLTIEDWKKFIQENDIGDDND
ncbi:MAG: helix-turn-helix transcriptional regulator [Bacillota bacterium]